MLTITSSVVTSGFVCFASWKDAVMIRQGASETREKAGQLKDTAETLTANVVDTANRMRQLESEASEDQGLTKEVTSFNASTGTWDINIPVMIVIAGSGESEPGQIDIQWIFDESSWSNLCR
jgi:hypothetical protein